MVPRSSLGVPHTRWLLHNFPVIPSLYVTPSFLLHYIFLSSLLHTIPLFNPTAKDFPLLKCVPFSIQTSFSAYVYDIRGNAFLFTLLVQSTHKSIPPISSPHASLLPYFSNTTITHTMLVLFLDQSEILFSLQQWQGFML